MPSPSQEFLKELDKKLWIAADRLRANLDAAVYKHAVLGLIFLKYVPDSSATRQGEIEAELRDPKSDAFLDPADYRAYAGRPRFVCCAPRQPRSRCDSPVSSPDVPQPHDNTQAKHPNAAAVIMSIAERIRIEGREEGLQKDLQKGREQGLLQGKFIELIVAWPAAQPGAQAGSDTT